VRHIDPLPQAVFFDLDDTLCDYSAAREARLRFAFSLARKGLAKEEDDHSLTTMIARSIEIHPHGADHFGELFAAFGLTESAAMRAAEWYRHNRFHALELFPDATDVLRELRTTWSARSPGAGMPLGIITNGPAEVQQAKIELLGIKELVDFVLISGEFGRAKPDPAIFQEALRRASVAPEEAIFVGDSPEFDIAGARAANIPSIWVNPSRDPWPGPGPAPSFEIQSLSELPLLAGRRR
jgi:putative hydrolase of the HAD superfamily